MEKLRDILTRCPHINEYDFVPGITDIHVEANETKLALPMVFIQDIRLQSQQHCDVRDVWFWTQCALMVHSDVLTLWHRRKRLLQTADELWSELKVVDLIMSKHVKSTATWSHRRWVLSQLRLLLEEIDVEREFGICSHAAQRYSRNYYAWTHRLWVAQRFAKREIWLQDRDHIAEKFPGDASARHYVKQLELLLV